MKSPFELSSRWFTLHAIFASIFPCLFAINGVADCVPAPSGLVSWWRGEANALDQTGTNNGTLVGNTTYAVGRVSQGFVFDGSGDAVSLGNATSLHLQTFTIEAWIKRASSSISSASDPTWANLFAYGGGGYALGLQASGRLYLSQVEVSDVGIPNAVTDTNWHHVAVTKDGGNVVFYVDGSPHAAPTYNPTFVFSGAVAIGARGDDHSASFLGAMDEVAVYSRPLAAVEVQAIYNAGASGKCVPGTPPSITSQPADRTVTVGETATFNVTASGTTPLSYQWRFNGTNLSDATANSLTLTNVQPANAGTYSVVISNGSGTTTSSNATLTVNVLSACASQPPGLVGWWRGEANALDQTGTNNGTIVGNAAYGAGQVSQAFVFDGQGDAVSLGSATSLHLQTFTIEAWIKRASSSASSASDPIWANLFAYGGGGYALGLQSNGRLYLSQVEVSDVGIANAVTDTNWHHVAVTKDGGNVIFYVDGAAHAAPAYNPTFVFSSAVAIGARGDDRSASFLGAMDEVAVYDRPLTAAEVQIIYNAGASGKCIPETSPSITSQPADKTVTVGETATFNVVASGSAPLSYQWQFNGTNINGATTASLVLTNVQLADAGFYSIVVSNLVGTSTSSNATLTVNEVAACAALPSGLVGWWRGGGNALDQTGTHDGALAGNATYGAGRVGQAFALDGSGDAVLVGNSAGLQLQDFTIEAWIKRASASVTSLNHPLYGNVFAWGAGGYALGLRSDGQLYLSQVEVGSVGIPNAVTGTGWHHVAVTKSGSVVNFYVDGAAYAADAYNPGFTFSSPPAIGAQGGNLAGSFYGAIDEVAVYNRPLAASEIQAIFNAGDSGKCVVSVAAFIIAQPANQRVQVGADATFNVTAGGTAPLTYQWLFNGTNIADAAGSTLTLTNVQLSQVGNYSVEVTNSVGSALSSNAILTVTQPPANLRVIGTSVVAGWPVRVPVVIAANGNENALSFSLNYSSARLTFSGTELGTFPPGTYFYVNTSQTSFGRLGVTVALPPGATFAAGTQELAGVIFDATIWLSDSPTTATVSFGDQPLPRGLTDADAQTLPATYSNGLVTVSGTDLEADSIPRPGGNRSLTVNDWVQAGRFAAMLDIPAAGGEFQRADSAPRATRGDGQIKVTDWVQAGRYFAGLDPMTAVGGPTSEVASATSLLPPAAQQRGPLGIAPIREVRVTGASAIQGLPVTLPVSLRSLGNENGLGFTVSFDPFVFKYSAASLGNGAAGASFNLNTNHVASGKLGLVMVLPTGNNFVAGSREIAKISLVPTEAGNYQVTLSDQVVLRAVSDPAAIELPADYVTGTVIVNPVPTLLISRSGGNVTLSWPAWADGFNLQSSSNGALPDAWVGVADMPQTDGNNQTITLRLTDETKFFRLRHP